MVSNFPEMGEQSEYWHSDCNGLLSEISPAFGKDRAMIAAATPCRERDILHEAHEALQHRMFSLSRNLTCEFREGLLYLQGRVSSYYQKQVAQEAVRRLDAVDQVVNQIEVVPV